MKGILLIAKFWPGLIRLLAVGVLFVLAVIVGLILLAYVLPSLAIAAMIFLALVLLLVGSVIVYAVIKLRRFKKRMMGFGEGLFTQQPATDPFSDMPPRPRHRVDSKIRPEPPVE